MIAEQAMLGTMMRDNFLIVESGLRAEQFSNPVHRRIFQAMRTLREDEKTVDVIMLLTGNDPVELGGANYVNNLSMFASAEKFDDHVTAMLTVWRDRERQNRLQRAATENWDIDRIIAELGSLLDNRASDHATLSNLLLDIYEAPFEERDVQKGAPSGIAKLDRLTFGFQDGELTILAARPSMGKSDVMLHIAKAAGWQGYLPIIFSLEMSNESLRTRLVASTARVSRLKMRDPYRLLTDEQKKYWPKAVAYLAKTNMHLFDGAAQTIAEIRMKIRKQLSQHAGLKPIIFIDYLTLIKDSGTESSMHLRVSELSKALKRIAKEFHCPVISLAQLSRSVEKRDNKRPILSDLRESGSIEEDADMVAFLYRESYYSGEEDDCSLEIIIAKNRNGPTGTVLATYNKFTGEVLDDVPRTNLSRTTAGCHPIR